MELRKSCYPIEALRLLGVKKVNTSGYQPQTDGLVERFNATLTDMIAKTTEKHGRDWAAICIQDNSAEFHRRISLLSSVWT